MQNWELLLFYPGRQGHFGDIKLQPKEEHGKWVSFNLNQRRLFFSSQDLFSWLHICLIFFLLQSHIWRSSGQELRHTQSNIYWQLHQNIDLEIAQRLYSVKQNSSTTQLSIQLHYNTEDYGPYQTSFVFVFEVGYFSK